MSWFGKKRDAQDANEMLRQYNAAEAERLTNLSGGVVSTRPSTRSFSGGVGVGELAVEDVFRITGRGLVATGKVGAGVLRVGDAVAVERAGQTIAETGITGIEMFRKRADEAVVGDLVGVLLRDAVDIARGDVIRVTASA